MKTEHELLEKLKKIKESTFEGWDFSSFAGKIVDQDLPWEYEKIVRKYLKKNKRLLDMGTGGGEFLLGLNHPYDKTSVTEGYLPNYELCLKMLAPLGIRVENVNEDDILPFDDNSFDIVINRHESYNISEVKRVLNKGGLFITQQVGGKNNLDLRKLINNDDTHNESFTAQKESDNIWKNNFRILFEDEYFPYMRIYDIDALVEYIKKIPWEFLNFNIENSISGLLKINNKIEEKGYFESKSHRFIIVSKKIK